MELWNCGYGCAAYRMNPHETAKHNSHQNRRSRFCNIYCNIVILSSANVHIWIAAGWKCFACVHSRCIRVYERERESVCAIVRKYIYCWWISTYFCGAHNFQFNVICLYLPRQWFSFAAHRPVARSRRHRCCRSWSRGRRHQYDVAHNMLDFVVDFFVFRSAEFCIRLNALLQVIFSRSDVFAAAIDYSVRKKARIRSRTEYIKCANKTGNIMKAKKRRMKKM